MISVRSTVGVPPAGSRYMLRDFPLHDLQVEDEDRVDDGHEQQREERRDRETTDLRVTERLPQRAAVRREWEEREDRRSDRDEHRTKAKDARIEERFTERRALLVSLLDEVEEHDDVAHDDTDEADDAEERHEAEGTAREHETHERACHAIGDRSEHDDGLHRAPQLDHEREVDREDADAEHDGEIEEALLLFL